METKKQEAIHKAYGEYADVALGICDENGWIEQFYYYDYFPWNKEEKRMHGELYRRPFSLQGIENNNGWMAIEESLPTENGYYLVHKNNHMVIIELNSTSDKESLKQEFIKDGFSHWQPIIKPLPPIY